jgi:hypothetical protein
VFAQEIVRDLLPGWTILMCKLRRRGLPNPISHKLSRQHRQRVAQVDHGIQPGAKKSGVLIIKIPQKSPRQITIPERFRYTPFTPNRQHSCGCRRFTELAKYSLFDW